MHASPQRPKTPPPPPRRRSSPGYRLSCNEPLSVGALLWRYRGRLRLTFTSKCSFRIAQDGTLTAIETPPLQRQEQMHQGQIERAAELVPVAGQAELLVVGYAYPWPHNPTSTTARLTLMRGRRWLLDKCIAVCGERDAQGQPLPFQYVRMSYDHAYGGPGLADNPLGRGYGAVSNRHPYLSDPCAPHEVACFAPIPSLFPARQQRLGGLARQALDAPIVELPDDFDWSYFQAAPVDQRVDVLQGDEQVRIRGMQPDGGVLQFELPSLNASAQVTHAHRPQQPRNVSMLLSQVHIDTHTRVCTLLWRGSIAVRDEADARTLTARLHVGRRGLPPTQPRMKPPQDSENAKTMRFADVGLQHTVATGDADTAPLSASLLAPFQLAANGSIRRIAADVPGAPWTAANEPAPPPPQHGWDTLVQSSPPSGVLASPSDRDMTVPKEPAASLADEQRVEEARMRAEAEQREAAKAKAAQEAEARRERERRRFEEAQQRAREAEARHKRERHLQRQERAKKLRASLYSNLG